MTESSFSIWIQPKKFLKLESEGLQINSTSMKMNLEES